jgi:hypothetical protein
VQDVLAEIQEVIDAPHLPFPDGNPLWQTDVKGAGDDRATDARVAQLEELIERVQRDIAEIKTDLRNSKTVGFASGLVVVVIVAIAVAALLAKVFHWLLESRLVSSICFSRWLKPLDRAAADKRYSTQPQRAEFA